MVMVLDALVTEQSDMASMPSNHFCEVKNTHFDSSASDFGVLD